MCDARRLLVRIVGQRGAPVVRAELRQAAVEAAQPRLAVVVRRRRGDGILRQGLQLRTAVRFARHVRRHATREGGRGSRLGERLRFGRGAPSDPIERLVDQRIRVVKAPHPEHPRQREPDLLVPDARPVAVGIQAVKQGLEPVGLEGAGHDVAWSSRKAS